jgi:3-hydroxyisobutyrate dehydrogenase
MKVSFVGLGVMGEPMAWNLAQAGFTLTVFNRSPARSEPFRKAGVTVAATARDAVGASDVIVLMLPDEAAIDAVLERDAEGRIGMPLDGRVIALMSTVAPAYSQALGDAVEAAGGSYVEAPVSGSRQPAEAGQLVIMAAARDSDLIGQVEPVFAAVGKATIRCGAPPDAMRMKLANNLLLIAMFEALAEATHFARGIGLDLDQFFSLVLAGPMANDLFRGKVPKLLSGDYAQQAAVKTVAGVIHLICEEARRMNLSTPVAATNEKLFARAVAEGLGEDDVIGIQKLLARSGPAAG